VHKARAVDDEVVSDPSERDEKDDPEYRLDDEGNHEVCMNAQ